MLAFFFLITFVLVQIWKAEQATVPPHIFIQRSIASGFWVSCCVGAHQTLLSQFPSCQATNPVSVPNADENPVYYLPIWFQAIKGDSAIESGIHLLPLVISLVVASIFTGILTSRTGYYTPFLIVGICFAAVGAGVLTTLKVDASTGQWIGYQILYGLGLGACFQAPSMAAQTVLPRDEVAIGASLMLFSQTLFGAIFVSVGQNVLYSQLAKRLAGILSITPQQIESAGVTGLFSIIPPQYHTKVLGAYNGSLRICFQVALVMACLTVIGGLSMEWRSVKEQHPSEDEHTIEVTKSGDSGDNKVDLVGEEKDASA